MHEYRYDTCIDCGAICEDTRCRQCWAKELLRQDEVNAAMMADVAAREIEATAECADAVEEAERIMGI